MLWGQLVPWLLNQLGSGHSQGSAPGPPVTWQACAGLCLIPRCPSPCLGLVTPLPSCAAWAVHIQNPSKLTPPYGLSFGVVTWERPHVPTLCRTFVFDLAARGSWNCFFSVALPTVKNKFSLCFLVRKSMLCAAHPPSPAGAPGLHSFGFLDVGGASGCWDLTEMLP